jgi:hypothetical protein
MRVEAATVSLQPRFKSRETRDGPHVDDRARRRSGRGQPLSDPLLRTPRAPSFAASRRRTATVRRFHPAKAVHAGCRQEGGFLTGGDPSRSKRPTPSTGAQSAQATGGSEAPGGRDAHLAGPGGQGLARAGEQLHVRHVGAVLPLRTRSSGGSLWRWLLYRVTRLALAARRAEPLTRRRGVVMVLGCTSHCSMTRSPIMCGRRCG